MTRRENVLRKYDLEDKSYSLEELSKISKVPLSILQEVYDRGIGAYKTNPSSVRLKGSYVKNVNAPMKYKLSKEQWAMARVYSFLDGNIRHDNDLRSNSKLYDSNIKMPYFLRKSRGRDLYWVVGEDGKKHSKEPIPKEKAEAQMRILYAAMKKERKGMKGGNLDSRILALKNKLELAHPEISSSLDSYIEDYKKKHPYEEYKKQISKSAREKGSYSIESVNEEEWIKKLERSLGAYLPSSLPTKVEAKRYAYNLERPTGPTEEGRKKREKETEMRRLKEQIRNRYKEVASAESIISPKKEGDLTIGEIVKNITGKGEMEGGKGNQKKLQELKSDFLKKWKAEHPVDQSYESYTIFSPLQSDVKALNKIISDSSKRLRGLKSDPPEARMRFKELVVIEAKRAIDSLFERAVNRGNSVKQFVDPQARHHHIGKEIRSTFDDNESESESEEEAEAESEAEEEEVVMQNPMRRAVVPPPVEERESVPSALIEQPSDRKMRFAPMRIGRGKHTKAVNKELDELLGMLEDAESELQLQYYPTSPMKLSDEAKKELRGSVKAYKESAKASLKDISKKYPKPTLLGSMTSLMDDLYKEMRGKVPNLAIEPSSPGLRETKKLEVRKNARNELRKKYQSLIAPNPYNAARTKYPDVARLEGGAFDPWDVVNPALEVADTVLPGTSTVINAIKNFLDNGETERRQKRQTEIDELESYMASKRERDRAIRERRTGVKTEAEKRDMQQYWEEKYAEKLGPDWRERIKQDPTLPGAIYGEVNREREEADKQYEDETFKDSAIYQEHKRNTALMDAAREKKATDSENKMWMERAKQMGVKTIEEAKALNEKRRLEGDGRKKKKKKGGALLHRDPTTKAYLIKEGNRVLFSTMSQREAIAFLNDLLKKEKEPKSDKISASRMSSMAKLLNKLG